SARRDASPGNVTARGSGRGWCLVAERRVGGPEPKLDAVTAEPVLPGSVVGTAACYHCPEALRVVHLDEVAELVHDQGLEPVARCAQETPVEADTTLAGRGTPARTLVGDPNPGHLNTERRSVGRAERLGCPSCFLAEKPLERSRFARARAGDPDRERAV